MAHSKIPTIPKLPVSTTTIFPIANSKAGGQMLTEYNLRTRESVANHSNIPYVCGPSYTHSLRDFLIDADRSNNTDTLYISGGYAIVHGHFVHTDSDTSINMTDFSNKVAESDPSISLSGLFCVGMIAMYSNETTLAKSLKVEENDIYTGIQFVILPKNEFKLPENNGSSLSDGSVAPTEPESAVTAHLLLGEFYYNNGVITSVNPNKTRHQCLDGEKISNLDKILEETYVTKNNLDPSKLYVMAGKAKSVDAEGVWQDYWTDATGSTMIWDANPVVKVATESMDPLWLKNENVTGNDLLEEAAVRYDEVTDQLKMVIPHKQVDGMKNTSQDPLVYVPKEIVIPSANRATGEGGVLDSRWVRFLNGIDDKISTMYRMPGGKMRRFIEVLTDKSELPQPPIGFYSEHTRKAAYYDSRLQYSFNLLQTQVAQLNTKFLEFESKLEEEWKEAVTSDVTADMVDRYNTTTGNIDSIRSDIANLQGSVASFQGDVSSIVANIQDSSDALTGHLEAYQALANRVTTLENQWTSSQGSSESTDQKQDSEIEEIKTKITDLQSKVAAIDASVKEVKTTTSESIKTSSDQLISMYNSLYGSSSEAAGDIKNLTTSVDQLRSQYDYLYDAIHDLYNGINAEVQKATSSLYSDLYSALKRDLDAEIAALADKYNVTAEWSPGDYVLVAQDQTVQTDIVDGSSYPSTMYVVVPGMTPLDSKYVASYYDVYTTELSAPINRISSTTGTSTKDTYSDALDTYSTAVATLKRHVPTKFLYGYELGSNDVVDLSSEEDLPDVFNSTAMLEELYNSTVLIEGVRGVPGKDYFVLRYRYPKLDAHGDPARQDSYTDQTTGKTYSGIQSQVYVWVQVYFTLNYVSDKVELDTDNPIVLSGGTPYAQEDRVGGFLNVSPDVYGGGYISRDEEGHLKLNDFEFLAAGVSAYQLGEDRVEGAGLDISELQDVFDQYVNQRIAFLNDAQLYKAQENNLRTDTITIQLQIGSTSEGTLNIYDIDSRFNTAVHLHITGQATQNAVINITNCQRLKITLDQGCNPTILLNNVCLYYDADVIDRIAQIKGLTLWYQPYSELDPKLEVDGMTVIYQGSLEAKGTNQYWTYTSGNDNSYAYALRQITFASDGTVIGMGVAVTDNTTNNIVSSGESIFASTFTLPQSIGLAYPVTKLTKQIKVTGNFITAYRVEGNDPGFSVKNTNFTILTQKYTKYTNVKEFIQGVISFYTRTSIVKDVSGVDSSTLMALSDEFAIDGWESGAYHIFYGGAVE